ncbi:hypothetical protein [Pannonibacter sp.]|uniref:hypothetical protein n=1 Tax=Pannonibacter sp. TaxID=1906786 RepID=UPI003F70B200
MRAMIASLWLAIFGQAVWADELPVEGDYFLIARQNDGSFSGSHKVLDKPGEGYVEATYCGRVFWVRPLTVAWTQMEVSEYRRRVALEFNAGRGWLPLCREAHKEVQLADLGITEEDFVVANGGDYSRPSTESRFKAISDRFNTKRAPTHKSSSYHQN